MLKLLDIAWRVVATGISFAMFGLGGLALSLTVFPFIFLLNGDDQSRRDTTRRAVSRSMSLYIWALRLMGLLSYDIQGAERLRTNDHLVIANHPTLLDVVFLFSIQPLCNCVVKGSLWRNPFTRGVVSAAQYIPNSSRNLVADMVDCLKSGQSLIIFPQGTRTPGAEAVRFSRGAAVAAIRSKKNIIPVTIDCKPPTLEKNVPWYHVPAEKPHFTISVGSAVSISHFVDEELPESRRARQLNRELEDHFEKRQA